jgi:hypothetical protein
MNRFKHFTESERTAIEEALLKLDLDDDDFYEGKEKKHIQAAQKKLLKEIKKG